MNKVLVCKSITSELGFREGGLTKEMGAFGCLQGGRMSNKFQANPILMLIIIGAIIRLLSFVSSNNNCKTTVNDSIMYVDCCSVSSVVHVNVEQSHVSIHPHPQHRRRHKSRSRILCSWIPNWTRRKLRMASIKGHYVYTLKMPMVRLTKNIQRTITNTKTTMTTTTATERTANTERCAITF